MVPSKVPSSFKLSSRLTCSITAVNNASTEGPAKDKTGPAEGSLNDLSVKDVSVKDVSVRIILSYLFREIADTFSGAFGEDFEGYLFEVQCTWPLIQTHERW
jgi:hypothetical protein